MSGCVMAAKLSQLSSSTHGQTPIRSLAAGATLLAAPDGGYGWICVAACFCVNGFTWGAVSVCVCSDPSRCRYLAVADILFFCRLMESISITTSLIIPFLTPLRSITPLSGALTSPWPCW